MGEVSGSDVEQPSPYFIPGWSCFLPQARWHRAVSELERPSPRAR